MGVFIYPSHKVNVGLTNLSRSIVFAQKDQVDVQTEMT